MKQRGAGVGSGARAVSDAKISPAAARLARLLGRQAVREYLTEVSKRNQPLAADRPNRALPNRVASR